MKTTYNPALRKSSQGQKLYEAWKKMRKHPHCDEWEYFPTFYEWAMHSGYKEGAWLRLTDKSGSYCPENCAWHYPGDNEEYVSVEWVDNWNKTVNRIRKHYGMPPLEGTEYGD
jgi:hypothetical protein